jgi:hypothetical protein
LKARKKSSRFEDGTDIVLYGVLDMTDVETSLHARWLIRGSPWILGGAIVVGLLACFGGVAPAPYLVSCIGIGVVWFVLLALALRGRSDGLRLFSLVVVCGSMQMLWRLLGQGQLLAIAQGCCVILGVNAALVLLLRCWLCKFAKCEDHALPPRSLPGA